MSNENAEQVSIQVARDFTSLVMSKVGEVEQAEMSKLAENVTEIYLQMYSKIKVSLLTQPIKLS